MVHRLTGPGRKKGRKHLPWVGRVGTRVVCGRAEGTACFFSGVRTVGYARADRPVRMSRARRLVPVSPLCAGALFRERRPARIVCSVLHFPRGSPVLHKGTRAFRLSSKRPVPARDIQVLISMPCFERVA